MKKLSTIAFAIIASLPAQAENFQSFTELEFFQANFAGIESDAWSIDTTYFFNGKSPLGPLNEFEFINKVSNVGARYIDGEDVDTTTVSGEAFLGNVLVGGSFTNQEFPFENDDVYTLTGGYLITDNLLIKVVHKEYENSRTTFFAADYSHSLSGDDYIGFSLQMDDETDSVQVATKYFRTLGQGQYFTLQASVLDTDFDTSYGLTGTYYLSQSTSFGLSLSDSDNTDGYGLYAQHYFTPNWAVKASYQESETVFHSAQFERDFDVWRVGLTAQF